MRQIPEDWAVESVDPSQTSSGNSSFKRVVNKVNSNARCRCCLWLVALFCAANVMFMLIGYDMVVEKVAVGQMVLQEGGGPKYEAWKQAPMPVYYKVTVFNLTNPHSFMKGDRPRLKECGPYTYRMLEEKLDVKFYDNDTVTYRAKPMYFFERELSGGDEEDMIWTVNIPLINAADAVKSNPFFKTVIQVAQKIHGFKTLRHLTVRELLWGYKSHVMDWARTLQDVPYPHPQFGLLVGFNNTPQEPYTMYTGASDPNFINTIYAWNGKTKLNFWSGDTCNEIKGTDASAFHPGVKTTDKLFIFNGQLCRSLPLVFDKVVVHSGVETFRFVPPPDTFAYGPKHPQNYCYCGKKGCPKRGLLDMKPCYYGAAVAFSFPHFYQSDPNLKHVVRGLSPNPELHGTQFDIYPALGVPLRVKLRMQMNVVIDGSQELQRARHFDIVFPVFWFEAGIDSLPGEMVGMLKMAQDLPSVVKTTSVTVCTTLTALFLLLLLASAFAGWCGITPQSSRTQTPDHLPDTHWPATPHPIINTSGYAAGSLASLGPDDSYRGAVVHVPPYRKPSYYPNSDAVVVDGFPPPASSHFEDEEEDEEDEDQPPAYSSAPNTTKASSSASLLSVEIHKSASMNTLEAPDGDHHHHKDPGTPEAEEKQPVKEEEENLEKLGGTPPPAGESPLAEVQKESPTAEAGAPEGKEVVANDPLATSSPSDSPCVTPSAPTLPRSDNKGFYSLESDSRPPPLESDL